MAFLSEILFERITFKSLSKAEDNFKSIIKSEFGLWDNKIIILLEDGSSFWMAKNDPFKSGVFQVFWWDFSCVSSVSIVGRVLCGNFNIWIGIELLDQWDVQKDRGDDDIWIINQKYTNIVSVEVEFIDGLFHQGFGFLKAVVGLPIATDESFISGKEISQEESIEHIFFFFTNLKNI